MIVQFCPLYLLLSLKIIWWYPPRVVVWYFILSVAFKISSWNHNPVYLLQIQLPSWSSVCEFRCCFHRLGSCLICKSFPQFYVHLNFTRAWRRTNHRMTTTTTTTIGPKPKGRGWKNTTQKKRPSVCNISSTCAFCGWLRVNHEEPGDRKRTNLRFAGLTFTYFLTVVFYFCVSLFFL